ncbi:conserved hypothetical protein [Methanolacinia petrolearia DSM 11571]|uniref:YcxB-like protein domain-containing protein n=1 Tax=Methanolacinia petrolearia (strain DSM 11571 / OCM 486 / SEBR 4847) TaxID=679926 RepID=E1RHW4_METP4|nr:hypothetical protein [Methanolacinia petrolearia]ADN36502.1 conserved hypothetical protein [Methanolacinia petrolearia DSM 11571]
MSEDLISEAPVKKIVWEKKIPLFSNTVVIKQLAMVIIIPAFFLMIFLIVLDPDMIVEAFMVFVLLLGIFAVLTVIAMGMIHAATKGGLSATFSLDDKGMYYDAGKNSRALNKITMTGGIMAGSPALLGGSMINISRESESMAWSDVKKITAYDSQKTIVAYRKSLISPVGLFCTDENYEEVLDFITRHLPSGVNLKRS